MRATNRTNFEMLIAGLSLVQRQPVINIKRNQLLDFVTIHCRFPIVNFQFSFSPNRSISIGNRELEIENTFEWLVSPFTKPKLSPGAKATRLLLARFKSLPRG